MKNETLDDLNNLVDALWASMPELYMTSQGGFAAMLDGDLTSVESAAVIKMWGHARVAAAALRTTIAAIPRRKVPRKDTLPSIEMLASIAPSDTEIKAQ